MEKTTSHTPGPWAAEGHYVHAEGLRFVAVSGGVSSCKESEAFANARLIAAAPELLSALRNIEEVLTKSREQNPTLDPFPLMEARAAIAKATGKA